LSGRETSWTYVPVAPVGTDHAGFAVPLRLASDEGELTLLTTLTSFATAVDVTIADLHLEAFLPADEQTAEALRQRSQRHRHLPAPAPGPGRARAMRR
jgi:hypothetical protein